MTPDFWAAVKDIGVPIVALVAVSWFLYHVLTDVIKDLRTQRDTANARVDALISGLNAQTTATTELTSIVREGFRQGAR